MSDFSKVNGKLNELPDQVPIPRVDPPNTAGKTYFNPKTQNPANAWA